MAEPLMDFERRKVGDGGRVFRNLALGPGGKVAVLSLAVGRAGAAGGGGGTTEQSGWVNVFGKGEQDEEEIEVESGVERILWTDQGSILVLNGQGRLYSCKSSILFFFFFSLIVLHLG